ncbi:uncharacterized protein DMAD_06472 [Drosophila madeirensis]|uniref:Uncharacterized protein n=1 Tax=Drosophila madeirensis TaxID=30013 RepID=A0AAU9FRF2_DROMD
MKMDICSSFNFSDFCTSFAHAPAKSFRPHLNISFAGIEFAQNHTNMLQGLPCATDVPTIIGNGIELDETLLKSATNLQGRSLGIIDATIENPYILPDEEELWIRRKEEKVPEEEIVPEEETVTKEKQVTEEQKVPEISHGRICRGLLGARLGASCTPFAASLNSKISFSSRVSTLMREFSHETPLSRNAAKNQCATLHICLAKLLPRNLSRLLLCITYPRDTEATGSRLWQKPVLQLVHYRNISGWQTYHILLCDKLTSELMLQMRLGGQWKSSKSSHWIHLNYADTPQSTRIFSWFEFVSCLLVEFR